jgi:hypothetical protein
MAALLGTRGATGRRIAGGIVPPARHPQTTTELGPAPSGRTPDRINCKSIRTREFPQVQTNTERAAKYTAAARVDFARKAGLGKRLKGVAPDSRFCSVPSAPRRATSQLVGAWETKRSFGSTWLRLATPCTRQQHAEKSRQPPLASHCFGVGGRDWNPGRLPDRLGSGSQSLRPSRIHVAGWSCSLRPSVVISSSFENPLENQANKRI